MDSSHKSGSSEETGTVSAKPTVCSICFESFKTPRHLPCSHIFCHNCLSAYILATCNKKKNPVGFPCPLCRNFAPAPIFPGKPDKWTEHFPINKMVQVMSEKSDRICDACKRENEEEVASDWCKACTELLCPPCAKAHRRNIVSRSHKVISISEYNKLLEEDDDDEVYSYCQNHKKKTKYFCVDHEEPCCTQCVCREHRTCTKIDTAEEAVQKLKESQSTESLLLNIQKYKNALIKAKTEGENNIKDLDNEVDGITKEYTNLRDDIVTHVETLLEKSLTHLARGAKENRDKIAVIVDAFSDQQILLDRFSQILNSIMEKSPSVFIKKFYNIKKQLSFVMQQDMSQLKITLKTSASEELKRILNISMFADLRFETDSYKLWPCTIDLTCATLHMICELADSEGDITGGCFMPKENIYLADAKSNRCLHFCGGQLVDKVSFPRAPRDILSLNQELMLVSFWRSHENQKGLIEKVSKDSFLHRQEYFKLENSICALVCSSAFIYAACVDFIVKLDIDGNIVRKFVTETSTFSVAVNKNNEIISSSCLSHSVVIMNEEGQKIYSYKHENLKYPYGLDLDFAGNIFVAGKDSNNIHALSPKGELLKIFNVNSPRCIRFKENSYLCFVGTNMGTSKVYEFKAQSDK
ncbi:uncharacterized protein LOC133191660 [Saccostrea echinata]|uniref:uncharacterized protein LOC133191660 n=1 Tax=Saccostrea echinata TaxID=191078 RepID=UPI002A803D65|nr:uncharacterized protein LOC133191660 [Saccostrea echinata]